MKSKTIGLLAGITIVGIMLAVFVNREPSPTIPQSGQLLFPDFMNVINDVKEIVIETKEQTVTLVRGENAWGVKEKSSYRANVEKVKQALVGMGDLHIHEPKTKNPELYERLGLQDSNQEGSLSKTVTVKTADNSEVAKLVVGNQKPAKGNPRMSDIYVRKPGDPQTWLVIGNMPLETVPGEWLDKEVTALTTKRVRQVTITHPNGDTLHLSKAKPEDLDFLMDSIPAGFKVSSQFNVNNVVGTLVQLELEDVKPQSEIDFSAKPGVSAVLETFDGLRLHVHTTKHNETVFAKFSADFDANLIQTPQADPKPVEAKKVDEIEAENENKDTKVEPPKPESLLNKPEEVQKEVELLNQRVKGWAYALPSFRVENFSKLKKDLIEKEK
ncbi:MAG: DUF4340 domain-containing protein [Nitrospirota bacterium]|nr:DUF4340 domain-containing protein [Nitrospirota bacterium]